MTEERTRIICYGDNLNILRTHVATESVDLVYRRKLSVIMVKRRM